MTALMKDELFDAQLKRALGYAAYDGADIGECLATADRITRVDLTSWYTEWSATADRLAAEARQAFQDGDVERARSAYLRAANYYRTAGVMLYDSPADPRQVESHRREVSCFRQGVALLPVPPQIVEIPYDGPVTLPGYWFAAPDGPRPTLILTGGYDGTAEELWFTSGAAAVERGWNVLAFDGPGQGAMLLDRGVVMRPDWDVVLRPVVDFVLNQPGVDPTRIALMGLSLGGYLAPRAAAGEPRLAACVSDCGPFDMGAALRDRLPGPLAKHASDDRGFLVGLTGRAMRYVAGKPTAGWALRRARLVHGEPDPLQYFRLASEYSMRGREDLVQCPTLVCSAESDDLSVRASELFQHLTCPKDYVQFRDADGAGDHCEALARPLFNRVALDWLDHVTATGPAVTE